MNPLLLRPYVLSKWICPVHGHFVARTELVVDPQHPVSCPDCAQRHTFVGKRRHRKNGLYFSHWICPEHGKFMLKTVLAMDSERTVACPACSRMLKFVDQTKGLTIQPVPFVSKPRIPKKTDNNPSVHGKSPLRKRGVSW